MKKNDKSVISVIAVFLVVILSSIAFFIVLQDNQIVILDEKNENPTPPTDLYLVLGSKHVPISAIEIFEEYSINLTILPEEEESITPLENFFIMGYRIPNDTEKYAKNPSDYELLIIGNVENPVLLTYEDLLTKFEIKYINTELYCTPTLRGFGKFVGPSLYDIIDHAKPNDNATKITVTAGDGYEKKFALDEIKEHDEEYILAMAMNEFPLAIEHGYPARLALPNEPGLEWVKWVIKIQIE